MKITRHTLDWNLPLLPAITQRLLDGAHGDFVDLSSELVIVPTVQSGRRLREALALSLVAQGRGLFPPEIVTPDVLLGQAIKDQAIASEESATAAWVTVLGAIDCTQFEALFPIAPEQSTGWQIGMAQRLMQLRNELGEEGLDFAIAAQRTAEAGHEPERWRQLARLEGLYLDQLNTRELQDPKHARRDAALTYTAPAHIQRIILAASPDPQPLPLRALSHAAESVPVEVWIYGSDEAVFDEWGRPLTDHWTQRALDLEGWHCQLQTVASPKAAAAFIAQSLHHKTPESVLLGLADPTLNPIVVDTLQRANIASYDPEGQALHIGGVGRLTELLCQLCEDSGIATIRTLLQHPDIQQWLELEPTTNELLRNIDRLFENHLAPDLTALIHFAARKSSNAELHRALSKLDALATKLLAQRNFPDALAEALQHIYANKQIQTNSESSIPWKERAEAIRKLLENASEAQRLFPQLPKDFSRSAFRQSLKRSSVYPDRPAEAHDLLGWLELLWNDAPHLILAGLNESIVPESVVGDAFLPETLREQLGATHQRTTLRARCVSAGSCLPPPRHRPRPYRYTGAAIRRRQHAAQTLAPAVSRTAQPHSFAARGSCSTRPKTPPLVWSIHSRGSSLRQPTWHCLLPYLSAHSKAIWNVPFASSLSTSSRCARLTPKHASSHPPPSAT